MAYPMRSNLRKYAAGKQCMIRLPGCRWDEGYTVLAHWRDSSTGIGKKEPDLVGAWACDVCHAYVDGRTQPPEGWSLMDVREAFLLGIIRTIKQLIREGVVKW